jgi:hypothetical protein
MATLNALLTMAAVYVILLIARDYNPDNGYCNNNLYNGYRTTSQTIAIVSTFLPRLLNAILTMRTVNVILTTAAVNAILTMTTVNAILTIVPVCNPDNDYCKCNPYNRSGMQS